jgi:phosphoribosyl-ATP pyrophosphohydrolase
MEQAFQNNENEPAHTVEIVVHISEELDEPRRKELIAALNSNTGIVAAEFCPLRYHLMLVRYDRDMYSSQDVLNRVNSHHVSARLIGPV